MLPRTAPATMTALARIFSQVTRPVSPTTNMPRRAISPSNAPSMRTPPAPLMEPCQMTPEPEHGCDALDGLDGLGDSVGVVLRLNMG